MHNKEFDRTIRTATSRPIQFQMDRGEQHRLEGLPWNFPLDEWPEHGVVPLSVRRGESRHPVIFVELHEHCVYWGDPSLANVLIRINGRRILAIMADAETAELFPGPVSDSLREQDLESLGESLLWQAEDLRVARGLPEEKEIVDDTDFRYLQRRYRL